MIGLETGVNLYGMMNSGKTTVGNIIAAHYDLKFVDTDVLIAEQYGQVPGDIIRAEGPDEFMTIQREIIMDTARGNNEVWATGGAVAKDPELVEHLRGFGVGVFLFVDADILEARTPPEDIAKLANPNRRSYRDLYLVERLPFYKAAADVTVEVNDPAENPEITAGRVVQLVVQHKPVVVQ